MCLYTNESKAVETDKDIVCYKTVFLDEKTMAIMSAIKYFTYNMGETYHEKNWLNCTENLPVSCHEFLLVSCHGFLKFKYKVHIGFHSFKRYMDAYGAKRGSCAYILKCVIPKGSMVFTGKTYTGEDSYCSNNITILAYRKIGGSGWWTKPGVEFKENL
jgi:hypothetical protein